MLRNVTYLRHVSWQELEQLVKTLADNLVTHMPVCITASDTRDIIPAILLSEYLDVHFSPVAGDFTFSVDNLKKVSNGVLFNFQNHDSAFTTYTPDYSVETLDVYADESPTKIILPFEK